jgi:hypothetical protein
LTSAPFRSTMNENSFIYMNEFSFMVERKGADVNLL